MSLRTRLVLGLLALALVALAAADVATYVSLRSFLFDRTDASLESAHRLVEQSLTPGGFDPRALQTAAQGVHIQIRRSDGRSVFENSVPQFGRRQPEPPPDWPRVVSLPSSSPANPDDARYLTVGAASGGGRYRVRVSELGNTTYQLLVATSLDTVDATLHRLLIIELLVTGAAVAVLAAAGMWTVRRALRPLERIGDTAAAIAAGDLSRRVEPAEERTEVGRLGLALNSMLAQIEAAFGARAASEARLRRFVADASHELRTPLSAVRAYAELFGRGADRRPADLARAMSGITRESERMSLLVDDLLLLARLDEGRPLAQEPVELGEVAAEAVETAHAVEPSRPIRLEADPAIVLGDRDALRQIVDNLLGNVRSHTPAGTATHVRVRRAAPHAVLEVEDEGPGIDPEQANHLFERFFRVDAGRAREHGGFGLGLSIVAAVAQAHGGSVAVRSQPGEGATFAVTLPLLVSVEAPRPPRQLTAG